MVKKIALFALSHLMSYITTAETYIPKQNSKINSVNLTSMVQHVFLISKW